MPNLRRISPTENQWGPVTLHGEGFQPPQYIAVEIANESPSDYGVRVEFDGEPAIFYHSFQAGRGRVTFEIKPSKRERHGLNPGWFHITQGGNHENLNETLSTGMKFQLVP